MGAGHNYDFRDDLDSSVCFSSITSLLGKDVGLSGGGHFILTDVSSCTSPPPPLHIPSSTPSPSSAPPPIHQVPHPTTAPYHPPQVPHSVDADCFGGQWQHS